MKVYTVSRMDKYDYDFSVLIQNYGAFTTMKAAKERANEVYKGMLCEYEDEMEDNYESDGMDIDDGHTYVEEDPECGYYRIAFGYEDKYESHSVAVDELDVVE